MASAALLTPPLHPGQRLTRDEFLRRWDAMPDLKKAELIDAIVYLASPVGLPHSYLDSTMIGWLTSYEWSTPGCKGAANGTWLMLECAPQPDACLSILPEFGGQSGTTGNYPTGAPELIVEVSASSGPYDRGPKLALYQRAGVREYITVGIDSAEVAWRHLVDGSFQVLPADDDGILRSRVFPGLWLDPGALLGGNGPRLREVLERGLASPEHAVFVSRLEQRRLESESRI